MILRLQTFLTGLMALLLAALLALGSASANPTSGGYQLFDRAASGISADIQLASLGNFAPLPETASEYAIAPNRGLPSNGVDYDNISTAGPGQSAIPRDLNEQTLFNGVRSNPSSGRPLPGLNNDPRFQGSDGFQKMEMTHRLPDGTNVTVHYQYNSNTGLPYDIKVVTPQRVPPVLQPGPSVRE